MDTEIGKLDRACIVLGFGCLLSYSFSGPLSVKLFTDAAGDCYIALAALALELLATGLGCILIRRAWKMGTDISSPLFGPVTYAISSILILGVFFAGKAGPGLAVMFCFSFVFGSSISAPFMYWFDSFLLVFRLVGRTACIELLVFAGLASTLSSIFTWKASGTLTLAACLCAIALAALCQARLSKRHRPFGPVSPKQSENATKSESYSLTPFALMTVAGFGTA